VLAAALARLQLGRLRDRHADEAEAFDEVLDAGPHQISVDRTDIRVAAVTEPKPALAAIRSIE